MSEVRGARIHIRGIVQGVGFRPFVYSLAKRYSLLGWVRNTSAGVEIEVDGSAEHLQAFVQALQEETPLLAQIDSFKREDIPPAGFEGFEILASHPEEGAYQPISADVSLCADCRQELFDPSDRRYRYPFINCTNCGPRFTIIKDIPYDRPKTTMAPFEMCPACRREYEDPLDRRYHAQPVACPDCGPQIWLEINGEKVSSGEQALQEARSMLREGLILGVKGLGGFHLACDATHQQAVATLRKRKLRVDKPFALMAANLDMIKSEVNVSPAEERQLTSRQRPIVILRRNAGGSVAQEAAPGQKTLGFMLPYTPLHELLIEPAAGFPKALVMTSGNLSEEPIATENDEARRRLEALADGFLMHNREIETRCDDSVVRIFKDEIYPLRRARGYAPTPLQLDWELGEIFAAGAELKNTFCLVRGPYAFMSHHIGDMENYETLEAFERGVAHYERLFRVSPDLIAYDLHPNYMATRYALDRAEREGIDAVGIQHHHAHIASCMAEHGLAAGSQVIGLAFDGTGYGTDGSIWGGEVLVCDYADFKRSYHLNPFRLPGGDLAVKEPWRVALALLSETGLTEGFELPALKAIDAKRREVVLQQIERGVNAPFTTSMGRLFDGVAALAGVREQVNYEAQAAIELEALVAPQERGFYSIPLKDGLIDYGPLMHAIMEDLFDRVEPGIVAARFHQGIVELVSLLCNRLRGELRLDTVVLSGGVWQNMILLERTVDRLQAEEFHVLWHRRVPANDGGLALGQAVIAAARSGAL
ncbi:MAG: carbamoyltransferase HypF [Anaerolineales bacterium]|jgi:hydrogenase maturation protein HypF